MAEPEERFIFSHCPACGRAGILSRARRSWHCPLCGFEYFHNVATAVGLFIEGPEGLLFLRRAREPGLGLLGLPGGFVDPGESAESALRRECGEELGWEPASLEFLCTFPNRYDYAGVPYSTCDLYFTTTLDPLEAGLFRLEPSESACLEIRAPSTLDPAELAFGSARLALARFLEPRAR